MLCICALIGRICCIQQAAAGRLAGHWLITALSMLGWVRPLAWFSNDSEERAPVSVLFWLSTWDQERGKVACVCAHAQLLWLVLVRAPGELGWDSVPPRLESDACRRQHVKLFARRVPLSVQVAANGLCSCVCAVLGELFSCGIPPVALSMLSCPIGTYCKLLCSTVFWYAQGCSCSKLLSVVCTDPGDLPP